MSASRADLLLGIDAGTSVVKVALFDRQGQELAVARRRTPIYTPQPAWSEADMEETWALTAEAIRTLLTESGIDPLRIAGVGLTGNMVGAWLIDANGRPVRRAILWNDGRTQALIDRFTQEQPDFMQVIFRTSGSVMQQGCTLPLLRWLAEHEPAALEKAAWVLCCKDWIGFRLTGAVHLDPTEASVMPGDARERGYSQAMWQLFGLEEYRHLFPPLAPSERMGGVVHEEAARVTGLRAGTPVVVGAGDVPASAIGLGAIAPSVACSLLGTNILNCLVTPTPLFEPPDVGLLFCLPGDRWLRATVNVSGTTSLDWFVAQFCAAEREASATPADLYGALEALAQRSGPGARGVLYLPYLSELGIISPFLEPAARAVFFGLTDRHTRGDLLQALYEGIALSIRDGFAVIPQEVAEIRLSGGGAKSRYWSQLIADCTGKRVVVPAGTEFGAKGAALLAAVGLGWFASLDEAVAATTHQGRRFEPNPDRAALYERRYAVYRRLQQDLRAAWRLAAAP